MKKAIVGLSAMLLTLHGIAQAPATQSKPAATENHQGPHKPGMGRDKELVAKLNLSADQQAKFKAINEQTKKDMEALKAQSLPEEQMREKRKAIMDARREKVKAILTDEQRKQMEAMKPERGPKEMDGGRMGKKEERFEEMAKTLNLSTEQREKLKTLQADRKTKIEAIRKSTSFTEEQKKAEMEKLRDANKTAMEQILTPEQLKQFQEMKGNRSHRSGKGGKPAGV